MASSGQDHRRNQSASNAIPLQTLNQDGNRGRDSFSGGSVHRRTFSERDRGSVRSGVPKSGSYAHLKDRSPSPPGRTSHGIPTAFITTPSGHRESLPREIDHTTFDSIAERGSFQTSVPFVGLSFEESPDGTDEYDSDDVTAFPSSPHTSHYSPRYPKASRNSLPRLRTAMSSTSDLVSVQLDDGPEFISPGAGQEDDTLPLTNSSMPHSPSGTGLSVTPDPSRGRRGRSLSALSPLSGLTSRFSPSRSPSVSRYAKHLGDDLPTLEHGESSPSGRASLSPVAESTIKRTSTMLKKMSTRVVNVTNESEVVHRPQPKRSFSSQHRASDDPLSHGAKLNDGTDEGMTPPRSPASEKMPSPVAASPIPLELPNIDRNPLRGKALGVLSPENKLRRWLLNFLVHPLVEPVILLLIIVQTIILAVDAAPSVYYPYLPGPWGSKWTDYVLLAINIVYTIELTIKVAVSGFALNPIEYSTINRKVGFQRAIRKKTTEMFSVTRRPSQRGELEGTMTLQAPDSLLRSFTVQNLDEIPGSSRQAQKQRLAHRAFLRHSFNRLDFVAVVSFWISFILALTGAESARQINVFRMMSCLRILRLLGITSGTSVILRSLKRAAPTLLNVGFLIGFFWLLFAIIGVQSFKSSLRRTCTWNFNNLTTQDQSPYTQNTPPPGGSFQFCGGYLQWNGTQTVEMPWLQPDGTPGAEKHKGFLCPVGSFCVEGDNPYNNTVSFDNILQSAEMVFVIMTSNTFTDIMYYLTDTDYLAAALFFAAGIVILTFWMLSLLIAVITSSFQVIREESAGSAFTAQKEEDESVTSDDARPEQRPQERMSTLKKVHRGTHWFWILLIAFDLIVMAMRTDTMHPSTGQLISTVELVVTMLLLFEILFRISSDWREFRHHWRNWFDLSLAIVTAIIQIPYIRDSGTPYAWLTIFQILRINRVVLAVSITRELIKVVLRHVSGVLNLILFVFLLTFLAAIFAAQLFRGQLPITDSEGNYLEVTFGGIFNSFLGMYQILSSENWTTVLYNVSRFDYQYGTTWIGATFFVIWYILANFIVLNMFIAVIQENFDVSEDQKRMQQVRMFLQQKQLNSSNHGTLSIARVFRLGRGRHQDPLDFGSAATEMLLKDAVVRDFLDDSIPPDDEPRATTAVPIFSDSDQAAKTWYGRMRLRITSLFGAREPNPFYSRLRLTKTYEELDPRSLAKEVVTAAEARKVSQREYLRAHPSYNESLFIFRPTNPIRRICQRIVGPGHGDRIDGVDPNPTVWFLFSAFIYVAIVGMVLLACVTTPLFELEYFRSNPYVNTRFNWFVWTDIAFAATFTVEALIKVIADGFFWTPNAYFRDSWGFIDGVVLITLWINILTSLYAPGSGSRAVGAFKALRALRLLNVSDSARDIFHSVIVQGGWKLVSAALVSLSLLIPFAIYGLNLFAGKFDWCNDWQQYDVYNLTDCVGESQFSPFAWDVIGPRRAASFYWSFDSFGEALFILFQIVSQEGWVDVMWSAQSSTGVFTQPVWFADQGNAVYFVVFNLLGAVFVLTLFVSVFMRNYAELTGVAFLTTEQRSWLEFRKLLRQVAPSRRPNQHKKRQTWQDWCYKRAVKKNGRWQRAITFILITHLILLCLEWYPEPVAWSWTRSVILLLFTFIYAANIAIRVIGLSWIRFSRSAWDLYALVTVPATLITAFVSFIEPGNSYYTQAFKLFLVSLTLLLIPRNNQLDQLFKTAAASFSQLANLLLTWFVLFLAYAIAFTQTFGLTRFGGNETDNINFRTVPKALILLFKMSVGEGWNQIMTDYAKIVPPYCTESDEFFASDCGGASWAYALFISWNILSMYIFCSLFISLIYESFSYVYQRSSGLSVISREEIRRYKQAWAEFDPNGQGFISKEVFPKFLGELSGVFEMRIYDGDFTVQAILEACKTAPARDSSFTMESIQERKEVDLALLNERLSDLPVQEIRRRRARMNTFYEEVLVSADPDRGIAFSTLLMILAHYKVISDNKSLRLEEFLRRKARLQRVEEAVNRNIVVGFFDTLYWSRKFRRRVDAKRNARMNVIPSFGVPEIFVHDESEDDQGPSKKISVPSVSITNVDQDWGDSPKGSSTDILARDKSTSIISGRGRSSTTTSVDIGLHGGSSVRSTPSASPVRHRPAASTASSIQPDWHFAAAIENATSDPIHSGPASPALSGNDELSVRSRANSSVSQNEMIGMFQDSAWGQSMRRSFTHKRPNDR